MQGSNRERALQMRLEGYTYGQIAEALGIHRSRAHQLTAPPRAIVKFIGKRANWTCHDCGVSLPNAGGDVHHKACRDITKEDYNDILNLIYLCKSCHRKAHGAKK